MALNQIYVEHKMLPPVAFLVAAENLHHILRKMNPCCEKNARTSKLYLLLLIDLDICRHICVRQ